MHLLVRETRSLDEAAAAVDLGHAPADLLVMSFSDADLGALAAAGGESARLVNLNQLQHPLSVDLYLEQTAAHARCIVVRLLGGLDYWRYGAEELAALCRARRIPLAVLPADGRDDPALASLSTVPPAAYARMDAAFRHGGPANMRRLLRFAAHLAGLGPDNDTTPEPTPPHGVMALDVAPGPLAAVVFYRSHLLSDDIAPITDLLAALRARGLGVGAIFVASLKAPDTAAYVARTLAAWQPAVVLNATGFSARMDDASPLDAPDVPVLQLILGGTSRAAWDASRRGLAPADLAMQVVLPELDGRLLTAAISFKAERDGRTVHQPDPDGIALAADRAAGWARLAATPRAQRRVAIVLSDYPAIGGQLGHAVGLDSFASLAAVTTQLQQAGYTTSPAAATALTAEPTPFLSLDEYRPLFATLPAALQEAVLAQWGEPPAFTLRHVRLGNVLALIQPNRGAAADRRAGYHDPDLPPRHEFIALYLWLRRQVDAIVHLGTHGSLEWLPGKAAALSATCWPRALTGGMPVIYPFIVNNPGEAAAAKRRLGAVTIGHLTPPLRRAGHHGDAAALERLIDEYAAADGLDRRRTTMLRAEILQRAADAGLLDEGGIAPGTPDDDALARLDAYLCDVKELQIRDGLHVFGTAPAAGLHPDSAAIDACAPAERAALLAALDGRFVAPGPAGAPSAGRLDVLPTGRNLSSVDPRAVPTRSAVTLAERAADDLLRRHRQDHGDWPRSLVLNVWGTATMRTGGEDLALALVLLGARPVWDAGSDRVNGIEILPLALLDRPRVDVTLRISGLFRDAFAMQVTLFAQAVAAVAARDEAPDWNPLAGQGGPRVFGPAPGHYGAAVAAVLDHGAWQRRAELGAAWLAGSATAYDGEGGDLAARVRGADAFLHSQDHAETDLLDSTEYAAHLGGFAAAAASLGADPALYYADGRTRSLAEQVARAVRGRAANPAWIAGMMRHGYSGAAGIARGVDALHGFAATLPDRLDRQFDLLHAATLGDPEVDAFLRDANPAARDAMAARFAEARDRGLWHPRRNMP